MILLIEWQTVVLTPPKTASDTLHRLFCSGPPWHGLALVGPHHGAIDKHFPSVPAEAHGFRVLLSVRHPLDRLVSLWCHKARLAAYEGVANDSFERFAGRVASGEEPDWLWRTTITELIGAQNIDGLLRAESLAEDLTAAGFQASPLIRHNASYRRDWRAYYTPELRDAVRPWAAPDCERFAYDWPG
jgi:hypothetical protein